MPQVYTHTHVKEVEGTERNKPCLNNPAPPTKEEIIRQLKEHFGDSQPDDVIDELATLIDSEFCRLKDLPYGDAHPMSGFAKYTRERPHLTISSYDNQWSLFDRESYPGDYSSLTKHTCHEFFITVVNATKKISLAYVKAK